jgi:hypothetical protein
MQGLLCIIVAFVAFDAFDERSRCSVAVHGEPKVAQ